MKSTETYRVQRKLYFGKTWDDCDWLGDHDNLKDARDDLKWARQEYSDNDEKYRIIHEIRSWKFYR